MDHGKTLRVTNTNGRIELKLRLISRLNFGVYSKRYFLLLIFSSPLSFLTLKNAERTKSFHASRLEMHLFLLFS